MPDFTFDITDGVVGPIRMLIADVDSTDYTFTDAELTVFFELFPPLVNAAATACETMARGYNRRLSDTIRASDGSMVKRRTMEEWLKMAQSIRDASLKGTLQTGTISVSEPGESLASFRPDWRDITELVVE